MAEPIKVFRQEAKSPLVPKPDSQVSIISAIEKGVINDPLLKTCNLDLSGKMWMLYTVTIMFLRASTVYLDNKDFVDLGGMMTMESSSRTNDMAEKTGNLVAKIKVGEILKAIINKSQIELGIIDVKTPSGIMSFPVKKDFCEEDRIILGFIQTQAAKLLNDYKFGLNPEDWSIYTIAFLFLKHTVLTGMRYAACSEEGTCMINIGDVIEVVVSVNAKKDKFALKISPCKEAKLNVKSDSRTES